MNEFEFIHHLREQARTRKRSSRVVSGIGDDAAVLTQLPNRTLLATNDLLIEGIDFYRGLASPFLLGHKALAVSLSDIAAMGGRPLWSLVSLGMPPNVWSDSFKDDFFAGYFALADQFGVTLVGGDVSESKTEIVIDSIVLGEALSGVAVARSTARAGDLIFVTGSLGGAAAGLKLLQMGARLDNGALTSLPSASSGNANISETSEQGTNPTVREGSIDEANAIERLLLRQLRPSPRVGWGIVLGEEGLATAMIDISDGLSSDLAHLCEESRVGALLHSENIPTDKDVVTLCGRRALDPLSLALHGGEDFELLFTIRPEDVTRLPKRVDGVEIFRLGEITDQRDKIQIAERNHVWDLQAEGFEHFRRSG
jgi:thiamine-monophosphate kinase